MEIMPMIRKGMYLDDIVKETGLTAKTVCVLLKQERQASVRVGKCLACERALDTPGRVFCSPECGRTHGTREQRAVYVPFNELKWLEEHYPHLTKEQHLDYKYFVYCLLDKARRNCEGEFMGYVGRTSNLARRMGNRGHFGSKGIFYQRDTSEIEATILARSNVLEDIRNDECYWMAVKKTLRPFGYNMLQ